MKLESIHRAIVSEISKGHIQLRELTQQVNEILGTNYLSTSLSARIRELPAGCYTKLTESRRRYYIVQRGAQARLNEKYGRAAA